MIPLANTLPSNSNDGYVAVAYIVFFAIVLIYVAIMAVRLGRVERKVEDLRSDAREHDAERTAPRDAEHDAASAANTVTQRERETA
jgi:hypothetical protein